MKGIELKKFMYPAVIFALILLYSYVAVADRDQDITQQKIQKNTLEKSAQDDNIQVITSQDKQVVKQLQLLFSGTANQDKALNWLRERDNPDVVAGLIKAIRFTGDKQGHIAELLTTLTGEDHGADWSDWMLWLQAHPEIKPFQGFSTFESQLFANIDPAFTGFIYPGVKHEIRMEEIVWGGVQKDGIPALTNPTFVRAKEAKYLNDSDLVFGVAINGDIRAYPYRIMDWHEMFNDVVGGVPISLAYCTLCGSGILYDGRVDGRKNPFVFGSSGFLYRSNKLMYDQQTHSLWNQFTGRPVVGELTGSGIELKILPVVTTTWGQWKKQNPKTKVLSTNTGYTRDYSPGKAYSSYFNSPNLMFPALTNDKRLDPKDKVFGLRITGAEKAWPLKTFNGGKVINDRVGVVDIVLIGDAKSRTVRAYRSAGKKFEQVGTDLNTVKHDGEIWQVTESALIGPEGSGLARLPGHLAYWFAWSGYLDKADFSE